MGILCYMKKNQAVFVQCVKSNQKAHCRSIKNKYTKVYLSPTIGILKEKVLESSRVPTSNGTPEKKNNCASAPRPKNDSQNRFLNGLSNSLFLCKKRTDTGKRICSFGGREWIRTTEVVDGRFTVCSLWPLGNPTTGIAYLRSHTR